MRPFLLNASIRVNLHWLSLSQLEIAVYPLINDLLPEDINEAKVCAV